MVPNKVSAGDMRVRFCSDGRARIWDEACDDCDPVWLSRMEGARFRAQMAMTDESEWHQLLLDIFNHHWELMHPMSAKAKSLLHGVAKRGERR